MNLQIPSSTVKTGEARSRGYFGSKAGAGTWQTIVNQIPRCDLLIEAFAGSAAISRKLSRPPSTILIDTVESVCRSLHAEFADDGVTVICADAISWLEDHRGEFNSRTVCYCDPPYVFESRCSGRRKRYQKELGEDWSHRALLAVLSRMTTQGVRVLISGYRSKLYDEMLAAWRRIDYSTMTRGGTKIESLWCNFEQPLELQDFRVAGANYRERDRLKRKKKRWVARLDRMAESERAVLLDAIDVWRQAVGGGVTSRTRGHALPGTGSTFHDR